MLISFNSLRYLPESLGTALDQSLGPLEIIAVDNASEDGSRDYLREMASRYPDRLRIILNESNVGLGLARNIGMDAARGKYVAFLDDDDWLAPDSMKKAAAVAEAEQADVVQFGFWRCREDVEAIADNKIGEYANEPDDRHIRRKMLMVSHAAWNKLCRLEFIRSIGLRFTAGIAQDLDWSYILLMSANRFRCLPEPLVYYRIRKGSISHSTGRHHLQVADRFQRLVDYIDQHPEIEEDWRIAITDRCWRHFIGLYKSPLRTSLIEKMMFVRVFSPVLRQLDPHQQFSNKQTYRYVWRGNYIAHAFCFLLSQTRTGANK